MRPSILATVLGALMLAAAAPASAGSEGACERALAKASGKFVAAAFKSAQRCMLRKDAGKLPAQACSLSAVSTGDRTTDATLAHARRRLRKGLGDCSDAAIGAMGFDASCPADGAQAIGRASLERCIAHTHMTAVQALVNIQFPQGTTTPCGNGVIDELDEDCDPLAAPTGCDEDETCVPAGAEDQCTCIDQGEPICGDGTKEGDEDCDPMASPTGCPDGGTCGAVETPSACSCVPPGGAVCGNGTTDPGEQCDAAGDPTGCPEGQTCSAQCSCSGGGSTCGNGAVDSGEQCDPMASPTGCSPGDRCGTADAADECTCTVNAGDACDGECATTCGAGQTCVCQCVGGGGGACGNGTLDAGEPCDPNATPTGCAAGVSCSASCACGAGPPPPPPGCDCCSFTKLAFTTTTPSIGGGGCGSVTDDGGGTLLSLDCGGLYFGGGGVAVPLPAAVPDQGTSITRIEGCDSTAGTFRLAAATAADSGSNRNCTSASVPNPEYPGKNGCLFGPPLPIPNASFVGASVCIVNRVTADAGGSGSCGDGSSNLNLPLGSDLYLEGDLLDGSAADRPNVPGIQPCPLCTGGTCKGGPNNGQSCTPGSSVLGEASPTSHDCPPPGGNAFIGTLPIPFALTTDPSGSAAQQTKTATFMSGQKVFCGFCGSAFAPNFQGPPARPCTSDGDCTTSPFTVCKQRTSGAFGHGEANAITERGEPAGVCVGDGAEHEATLVSVFCIPPAFNATVDANGDLPGPGAVALPGRAQLQP